jgi:hypothetical protein
MGRRSQGQEPADGQSVTMSNILESAEARERRLRLLELVYEAHYGVEEAIGRAAVLERWVLSGSDEGAGEPLPEKRGPGRPRRIDTPQ